MLTAKFDQLVKQLRILPGVGQKSAQRMALHLLTKKRPQGMALAQALDEAMRDIVECQRCHTWVGCNGARPGEVFFLSDCSHELKGTGNVARLL